MTATETKPDLLQASEFVRDAMARMETSAKYFLSQEAIDIMAGYDGPVESGDPDGWTPKNMRTNSKQREAP